MDIDVRNARERTILRLGGDFISEPDQEKFRHRFRDLVAQGSKHFVIDLSHVNYINSCGLGSLVCALTTVRKAGGDIALVGAVPDVQAILVLTRLHTLFEMHESLTDFSMKLKHDLN
jgi:anti-sigma B factor antagonist